MAAGYSCVSVDSTTYKCAGFVENCVLDCVDVRVGFYDL